MRTSIRNRRTKHRIKREFELQLTSLMDVLIILLLFLLKSYATNAVAFATASNIKLPTSTSPEAPLDALNLVLDPEGIVFDNERVLTFMRAGEYEIENRQLADAGRKILPLYDALVRSREKTELLMSKAIWIKKNSAATAGKPNDKDQVQPKFQGTLVLQADKEIRYELIRKVMYTAGAAQYKVFKLVALKKEE